MGRSGTGRGPFAMGQGGTAVGLALGLQSNTPLPGEGEWQNISGGSVWALPLLSQAGPAWLSTQDFQLPGQAKSKQKGDASIPSPGSFRQGKTTVPAARKGPDVCSQSWTLPQQMTVPDSIVMCWSSYLHLQLALNWVYCNTISITQPLSPSAHSGVLA